MPAAATGDPAWNPDRGEPAALAAALSARVLLDRGADDDARVVEHDDEDARLLAVEKTPLPGPLLLQRVALCGPRWPQQQLNFRLLKSRPDPIEVRSRQQVFVTGVLAVGANAEQQRVQAFGTQRIHEPLRCPGLTHRGRSAEQATYILLGRDTGFQIRKSQIFQCTASGVASDH